MELFLRYQSSTRTEFTRLATLTARCLHHDQRFRVRNHDIAGPKTTVVKMENNMSIHTIHDRQDPMGGGHESTS
jgi:hypothetical protein